MAARIVVVDYHKGNLSSVVRGIERAGGSVAASDDPDAIAAADALLIPGVGSFEDAMDHMRASGQEQAILEQVGRGTPLLGICLGLQVLFESGEERSDPADGGTVEGMGLLAGSVPRLRSDTLKVPHVGWDTIEITGRGRACPILAGVESGSTMYFTHSYVARATDEDVVASRTDYTCVFPSVVWRDNVYGCQFHPEKSSGNGARIMENFVRLAEGRPA